jgi:Flp pilus assembly pilin Flp
MDLAIRRRTGQAGQGLVEYALILCLVAVIMIVVLISLGGSYLNLYSDIENGLAIATGA